MKPVICLMGPTACGKTGTAINAAQQAPFDIISVDSAMVYRGMDIGTAKPTLEELALAPHRLIDICDPCEAYSAGQFLRDVKKEITKSHAAGRIPLLVGGTMMYFYQLQNGMHNIPSTKPEIRKQVAGLAQQIGWPALHEKLSEIDLPTAIRLKPQDAQRIARAYEIYLQTGKPLSVWHEEQVEPNNEYDFYSLILAPESRAEIHKKIAMRFDNMLAKDFIDEVKELFARGDLNSDMPSIRSVGYRQAWSYLKNEIDFATMREQSIMATRQLCKRQFTWLRRWQDAIWVQHPNQAYKQLMSWVT